MPNLLNLSINSELFFNSFILFKLILFFTYPKMFLFSKSFFAKVENNEHLSDMYLVSLNKNNGSLFTI